MSLILQALQRARKDTAGEDPGLSSSRIHHPQRLQAQPRAPRLWPLVLLVIATTMLSLGGVVFAVYYVVARMSPPATAAPASPALMQDLPVAPAPQQQGAGPLDYDLPPPVPVQQVGSAAAPAAQPQGVVVEDANAPASGADTLAERVKSGFSLGAILYDDNMRIAVINGEMIHEGEDRGEFRITEITPRTVTIEKRGESQPIVLRMGTPQ